MSAAQAITFINEEATKVVQPHDNVLMVALQITNHNVHQVLIDTKSSMDVLFRSTYS